MPFHVRITTKSKHRYDEVRLDLTFEELERRFLVPYREGRPIVIGGKTVLANDIERIRINDTDEDSETLRPIVNAERRSSGVVSGLPTSLYIAAKGKDVTDDLITSPPGGDSSARIENASTSRPAADTGDVFVVHGRNLAARDALFDFLRSIGLHPVEWAEAVRATGRPAPYVGEILNAAFARAHAVVVLLTPDDEARLQESLRSPNDPPHEIELSGQARPNVLFEAGMAMGRHEERTVLVELGELRPFSDIAGRHVIRLDDSSPRRQEFAQRLQAAGCPVDLDGTDWHRAGDFSAALT